MSAQNVDFETECAKPKNTSKKYFISNGVEITWDCKDHVARSQYCSKKPP